GTISGVTEFGLYVEVDENKCEGMIPMRTLLDDYYEFDERNYCLIGRRTHHRYNLGDKVKIRVERANLERRQLDFSIISDKSVCIPTLSISVIIVEPNPAFSKGSIHEEPTSILFIDVSTIALIT
ncbi:MAG: S1 RNA-binding domain-containing protein, partial [Clostridia bacterium]